MKIKQELLETLIRVCAKEVIQQLNEGKKSKKCSCGGKLIFGEKKCKTCSKKNEEGTGDDNLDNNGSNDGVVYESATESDICSTCNGSGEGKADGEKCTSCKGSGSTAAPKKTKNTDPDYDWDSEAEEKKLNGGIDEDETVGAAAPPAAGLGTADTEAIPSEDEIEIDDEPSADETPKKKEKLRGIVLITPSGELRQVPMKQWPDEAFIERTLHRIAASIAGRKVKISISAMKKVKAGVNDETPTYVFLGTFDPEADELFLFADRDLNRAKEEMATPEKISGEEVLNGKELYNRDQEIQNDDELLGKHLAGDDKPALDKEIGYDDSESGQDEMKQSQLQELISNIVKTLVKEYSLMDNPPSSLSNGQSNDAQITDPNNQLASPMSTADQQRFKQIKDKQNRDTLKSKTLELDTAKKKLDFTQKDEKQMRNNQIPNLQKTVQQLKSNQ